MTAVTVEKKWLSVRRTLAHKLKHKKPQIPYDKSWSYLRLFKYEDSVVLRSEKVVLPAAGRDHLIRGPVLTKEPLNLLTEHFVAWEKMEKKRRNKRRRNRIKLFRKSYFWTCALSGVWPRPRSSGGSRRSAGSVGMASPGKPPWWLEHERSELEQEETQIKET